MFGTKAPENVRSVSRSSLERTLSYINDGGLRPPAGKITMTDDLIYIGRGESRGKGLTKNSGLNTQMSFKLR